MPNLNGLVVRASDYKLAITLPGPPAKVITLLTWENFSWNDDSKTAHIYAGGVDDPIAIKQSEYKYGGRLGIQFGEWASINATQGINTAMKLGLMTLTIVELNGVFSQVYSGVMIKGSTGDVRRGDLETLVNLEWLALGKS